MAKKDYEEKIEELLEGSEKENVEVEIEVKDTEQDLQDLVGVLKSEMDDAKDFINQVGQERAESTEYYLGNEPESTSSLQSEFISTFYRC
jgi:hypothetical protein